MFGRRWVRRLVRVALILLFCSAVVVTMFRTPSTREQLPQQSKGRLRRYYPEQTILQDGEVNLNVIIIPELGYDSSRTKSWDWLDEELKEIAPNAQILLFEYELDSGQVGVWQSLIRRGGDLLHSLLAEGQQYGLANRPVLFICHGLGGLILKRAIVNMIEHDPGFHRFLDDSSGIVFLGTPHPHASRREQWFRLGLLLRSDPKISKLMRSQAELEADLVALVSEQFEEADLDTPVISVFETKATRINEGFFRRRKEILVDRGFAQTQVKHEALIEAPVDHHGVHSVRRGTAIFTELEAMVQSTLQQLRHSGEGSGQPSVAESFWAPTATSINLEHGKDHLGGTTTRAYPTHGSSERPNHDISTVADILESRPAPVLPCYLLKGVVQSPEFYGREDILAQLDEALLPSRRDKVSEGSSGPNAFALCGLGGIGKTQIAAEFAHTRKEHFDAVFWIQADESSKLAESFVRIATVMKLTDPSDAGDYAVSRSVVLEWLIEPSKASQGKGSGEKPSDENLSWLMIFDNADNLELLQDFWPVGASQGSIIITSKDPLAKTYHHYGGSGIDLDPFSSQDAAALLGRLTGKESTKDAQTAGELLKISDFLGGLPLAITQIAAYIRTRDITYQEMLRIFSEDSNIVYSDLPTVISSEDQYKRSLPAVWALGGLPDTSGDLLDVISLLDPDCIQERILTSKISPTPLENYPSTYTAYTEARRELLKYSLVKRNKEQDHLKIHRLVQDFRRDQMSEERLSNVFELVVELLINVWPTDPVKFSHTTSAWETGEQILPHVMKLYKLHLEHKDLVANISNKGKFAELLKQSGWYLKERASFDMAKPLLIRSLELLEQEPNELQVLRADLLFSLASLFGEANDAANHLLFARRHLDARLETGLQDKDLGMGYAEQSVALSTNGMYKEALESGQKSLEIYQKTEDYLNGSYWPHFAIIHQALALLAMDRGREAIGMLQDTLKWRLKEYGANDTESFKLGYVLQVLGNIYVQNHRWREALDTYNAALANYKKTVGMNYHRTGHLCVKIAECHGQFQQYETADIFLDQAIKSFSSHPYYLPEITRANFIKAQFLLLQGDTEGYEELLGKVEKMYDQLRPGHKRPITREDIDGIVFIWSR